MALGDLVGEVKEVIFDPMKPQLLKFIVVNPLTMSRVVNIKGAKPETIHFN